MNTILVVDDMELFREPIAAALRAHGFEAVTAADGHTALRLARNNRPDLILLDMAMPQMDGLAVLASMRVDSRLKDIPVILLTAVAERDYVVRSAKLGVKHYMLKTQFSLEELIARVNTVLLEHAGADPGRGDARAQSAAPAVQHKVTTPAPSAEAGEDAGGAAAQAADPSAELKSLKPLMTRSKMFDRIDGAGELQGMSPTVMKVLKLTEQESSTIEEIARVIKQDSAVAIKILRIANSVAFARGNVIDTIDKAVARLGFAQIRQAMLNLSVMQHFAATRVGGRTNLGQFWEHSTACAIIASQIALTRSQDEADLAFTMGLVHDLGKLMFSQELGETYEEVFRVCERLGLPLEQVESRLLIVNHAEAMDRLLHAWSFPKELIDPVVFHHLPLENMRQVAPKRFTEVATLALADRLCHALVIGNSGNEMLYSTDEYCEALSIDAEVIARIEGVVVDQAKDLKLALIADSKDGPWTDAREELRSRIGGSFRPLVVCENPGLDAVRIFCDQVRDTSNEQPNIAIVHATTPGAHARLVQRLAQLEREEMAAGLSAIVLSPVGQALAREDAFAGRSCVHLSMPVAIETLVQAIGGLIGSKTQSQAA